MSSRKCRVLLTNDDGPPGPDSPYIYGLYRQLATGMGWDVKVVIPSSQKSWIGGAFQIKDTILGNYYYPRNPDGLGETSHVSRPLKDGEFAEWILLDGTPATCANIALHNIYPDQIDLVISGPNFGRNSSSAFALSSGTVGAAMSSSLAQFRSIALSYGTVQRPTPKSYFEPAHVLSAKIIKGLWDQWGRDDGGTRNGEVDMYNINIPMIEGLLSEESLKVVWTTIWRNAYGRLFKHHIGTNTDTVPGGPDAQLDSLNPSSLGSGRATHADDLMFKFSPDIMDLINPPLSSLPVGSDAWALARGMASVTPLRANFAEPPFTQGNPPLPLEELDDEEGDLHTVKVWKLKL